MCTVLLILKKEHSLYALKSFVTCEILFHLKDGYLYMQFFFFLLKAHR